MNKSKSNQKKSIERYSTGINEFNALLNGGLPIKKIINVNGSSKVGKTTILLQISINIIRRYNKKVFYFDIDGGLTYELLDSFGGLHMLYNQDTNPNGKLFLLNVSTIQEIIRIVDKVTKDNNTALIIIDSETSVIDKSILRDKYLGSKKNGVDTKAKMWSNKAKTFKAIIRNSNASMITVSQARWNTSRKNPVLISSACNGIKYMSDGTISIKVNGKSTNNPLKISISTSSGYVLKSNYIINTELIYGKGI